MNDWADPLEEDERDLFSQARKDRDKEHVAEARAVLERCKERSLNERK